jgi:phage/plasmid primase-like uncharacterized protein
LERSVQAVERAHHPLIVRLLDALELPKRLTGLKEQRVDGRDDRIGFDQIKGEGVTERGERRGA